MSAVFPYINLLCNLFKRTTYHVRFPLYSSLLQFCLSFIASFSKFSRFCQFSSIFDFRIQSLLIDTRRLKITIPSLSTLTSLSLMSRFNPGWVFTELLQMNFTALFSLFPLLVPAFREKLTKMVHTSLIQVFFSCVTHDIPL